MGVDIISFRCFRPLGLVQTSQFFKNKVLAIQGAIGKLLFAFIIFTSNPFERVEIPPFDGQDLNPLLQDPGSLPSTFFIFGLVGLSMAFFLQSLH